MLIAGGDAALEIWPTSGALVIVDLEWTAWEGSLGRGWSEPWEFREIIAIGGVRVDAATFETLAEFEVFVRPLKNPSLSAYIVRLTGITDGVLAECGLSFSDALDRFRTFVGDAAVVANGSDGTVLRENCVLNSIPFPFEEDRVLSIRRALEQATGLPSEEIVSAELPVRLGFGSPADRHGALADARAITASLVLLRSQGAI